MGWTQEVCDRQAWCRGSSLHVVNLKFTRVKQLSQVPTTSEREMCAQPMP